MGRIPDHLLRLAQRVAEGRWVTIGAKADPKRPGKKKGGTPVELDGEGVIQKGPAALTGKRPSELSQSHLFTGQPHKSQRKLFAEPGDPVPPPRLDPEAKPQAQAPAKKEPKPKAKKPQNMSLLAVIRREGGISGGDFEHADFREHGLLGALNKNGFGIDDMAAMLVRGGHIIVPHGVSSPGDHLLQLLKKKTNSLLADKTSELEKDYEAYARAREEALAHGHESGDLEEVRGRGQEAGADAGTGDILEEIFGPDLGRGGEAGAEEPGDLAGDAAEPASGVDTSFDFGPAAAPKVEDKPKAVKPRKPKQKKDWEDKQEEKHQKALADVKAADAEKAAVAAKARELLGKVTDPGQKDELQKLIARAEGKQAEPAPPPAVEPEPAAKQPHEMTAAEYLRSGRPNYGDLVQTPDGKVGTLQGGGGIGSTRVKVNGVWHDRNDLKLVKRPDKDTRQNLSDEWKAKQKADLEKIEREHGEVLHKKSMVDSAKKRLQAGTMTQDQYDKFVGSGPYKMTDAEMGRAEKAQAEIDAIKDRPLEFDQSVHAQAVDNALAMGKDVPANVLAEYPDLAKKYGKGKAQGDGPAAPPALDKTNDKRPKIGDTIKTRLGGSNEKEQPDFEINLMPATKPGHFAIGQGSIKQREIPLESFDNFIDDMTGKVSVPADSGVAEIDAVASGKAKHLGRGDDGSAFQVGDKVVKTSTVSPFIPTNPGHRTPQEGLNRLHDQTMTHNKLAEILKEKGVGGVEPLEWHEHGGRGFAVSNLLDTKAKLNAEQIAKVRDTVDAIHDAGYVVGDDIQVGLNKNGDPVIYDLGKARKQNGNDREKAYDLESDSSKFNKLAKQNGHEDLPPLRSDIKAELNRIKNSTGPFAQKIRDRLQAQLQQLDAGAPQQSETQDEKVQRLYSEYQDAEAAKAKAKQENDFSTRLFAAGKAARARGELESLGLDPNSPPPPKPAEDKNQKLLDEYRKAKAARQAADNSDNPEDAFHADDALWNAEQALKKAGLDPAKDPQQSLGPAAPPKLNLFGQTEPTKPQPATTQGLFGEQVPVEDKKTQPQPTAADDAAKGLDWLDQKQDRKTDGTGEMFGGLFSPGQQASQGQQEPVAPPKVGKQPHEMTRAEFAAQGPTDRARQYLANSGMHRGKVQAALDAGQNVPAEVLAEYPGIKKTEPQQGPTAAEITGKIQAETDARRAQAKQDDAKARVRDVEDYQQARQAAIDAGQDVNDGDEKQMRRMIRQNEKDRARALQTIANNGPDAEAQAYADKLGRENERLQAKLAKSAGPVAPPAVEPSPTAAAARTLSLPDRIKNLNALLNKTRSRANAKALRATIAQLEREAEGSTAPPKVETAAASTGPKSQSFDDFRRENGVQGYTIDHSMLSPSGRVSGRSANAARARVNKQFSDYNQAEKEYQAKVDAGEIVDPTGKYRKPDQAKANKAEAERMREKAKNFRSIAARGMQTRKLTKQAEELERQANELDPPAGPETGPTTPPPVEPVPSQGQMGGAKRRNLVGFNPIKGPSGAKLTGYNWEYDLEHYVDQRGEDRERKVSAWDRAERAGMTNRDIVHMFNVEGPDGKQHTVSLETAAKMLGYDGGSEQFKAKFKSATSAAKTLAKLQMEKAQAEQSNAARQKALDELKQQVPAMTDDQVEEVPGFLGNKNGLRIKGVDGSTVVYSRDGMGRTRDEAKQFLKQSWIEKELKKRGHDPFGQKSLTDIDRRILRAKNKLDELTKQASTAPATESARIRALLREALR